LDIQRLAAPTCRVETACRRKRNDGGASNTGRSWKLYAAKPANNKNPFTKSAKPRKHSFGEARELEAMEAQIHAVDADIAHIEGLFASPDFHRTHATQTRQLTADLAAAKENLAKLYARWGELEAIKAATERP
jgi:ATP-binding cassette subfamily F protein uup